MRIQTIPDIDNFYFDIMKDKRFSSILYKYSISQNQYLAYLEYLISKHDSNMKNFLFLYKKYLYITSIKEKKIGVIADIHIGDVSENFDYIIMALDYFKKLKIETILILGDLLNGPDSKDTIFQKKSACFQQIKKARDLFPKDFNILTLLGNHDYKFFELGIDLESELMTKRNDFSVLGYGGCHIDFNQIPVYLHHPINADYLYPSNFNKSLTIEGHSHFFHYNASRYTLKVGSCSDNQPNRGSLTSSYSPGFGVLSKNSNYLTFDGFIFENSNIVQVLSLKL